ncbi:MAG: cysteine methyltransferase [Candidatus Eremiobacter antarcticus]|nr:methylated-DNA--[protein]-cysteine S-methyltransferase [Candidatus Eremiobacteraeota bacterium]PZR60895.1 MAG: cysteine methyltransferase [Candidatus Eremiobacter sp. RRmetagenome_bin22]
MNDSISIFDSPVGPLLARASHGRLVELSFYHRVSTGAHVATDADAGSGAVLEATQAQIMEYFAHKRTTFELPLELRGPTFHQRVWEALCEIPYGKTASYGQLAAGLGVPDSARAVGAANGANPIAIIVPCHRVIGADGSLVGYGGGLHRKRLLLDLESHATRLALL